MAANHKHLAAKQMAMVLEKIAALQASGKTLNEACQVLGISPAAYRRWKVIAKSTKPDHIERLKQLEAENGQLKRMLDNVSLREAMLREVLKGNY